MANKQDFPEIVGAVLATIILVVIGSSLAKSFSSPLDIGNIIYFIFVVGVLAIALTLAKKIIKLFK